MVLYWSLKLSLDTFFLVYFTIIEVHEAQAPLDSKESKQNDCITVPSADVKSSRSIF